MTFPHYTLLIKPMIHLFYSYREYYAYRAFGKHGFDPSI